MRNDKTACLANTRTFTGLVRNHCDINQTLIIIIAVIIALTNDLNEIYDLYKRVMLHSRVFKLAIECVISGSEESRTRDYSNRHSDFIKRN